MNLIAYDNLLAVPRVLLRKAGVPKVSSLLEDSKKSI